MKVTVLGTGYVGLVAGTCLAVLGNDVTCLDVDEAKITALRRGELPIYEPGLAELVADSTKAGRLRFTTSYDEGVAHGDIIIIAVGTPQSENGSADLSYVTIAAQKIGQRLSKRTVIVNKSTVPVGTAHTVASIIAEELDARSAQRTEFALVSNPEFLKEGTAVEDFMRPDRIVLGCDASWATETMRRLYAPLNRSQDKIVVMSSRSAELTKYAANAMLATRISFMNELSHLAEAAGADIEDVRLGIGSDPRIGRHFLYAGAGYGGSCFPKDVKALIHSAANFGADLSILRAVDGANQRQKEVLSSKIRAFYGGGERLDGKVIAIWGLAFKPETDDMREAPSLVLIERLLNAGATVRAYDPVATISAARVLKSEAGIVFCDSAYDALKGAHVLAVVTEYREFRTPDFPAIAAALGDKAVFDGRNLYAHDELAAAGLSYHDIGRFHG